MTAYIFAACFAVYMYFQERHKRKVAYVMHIQERTEEAETLDFGVTLFEDESVGQWAEKLEKAYSIAEARRGYNNKRMIDIQNKIREEAKNAPTNVTPLKKV